MADVTTDPTTVDASSEPKLAPTETELATNPAHGDAAKEEAAPAAVCVFPCRGSATLQIPDDSPLSHSNADNNIRL